MKTTSVRAALAVCLLSSAAMLMSAPAYAMGGGAPDSSPAPARASGTEQKVSAAVGKLLLPASKLMTANDFAGALVLVKQAQALPDQTATDTYKINEFLGNIYVHENDHVNAELAYIAMAESPALADTAPDEHANTLRIASLLSTEQKHYDQGIKYAMAFLALGKDDPLVLSSLAQAYYYKNDFANAVTTAQKVIAVTPAGTAPNRGALEILFGSQLKAKQQDAAMGTLETIVTYYDDPDEWGQVVDVSLGTKGIKDVDALHMYRLRIVTHATGHSDDYTVAAAIAIGLGYPVEADAILQAGQGKIDSNAKNNAQIAEARSRAAKDRATLAGFDAVARKSPTGEFDLKLAETYYGYGRYAEAAEAAQRALTKGGAKADPNEANMVLGEALIMQGKTAEAVAAFNAVHNASPGLTRAQHIWLIYANRKYGAAAAPAPAH